ncbi:hypothetical protein ACLB2K_038095 [Fragaria x ananassa]
MQVMVIGVINMEEQVAQIAQLTKAEKKLQKTIEEKDVEIASLMEKLEVHHDNDSENNLHGYKKDMSGGSSSEQKGESNSILASLSVQQLQDMIAKAIKAQYGGSSRDTLTYSKPYTKWLDNLRMPTSYQPSKFQQFDGKGNPKQHIAHFIETCNNAGTDGDHLMKQFVRLLRGMAFEWFTNLEPESIDRWEQMENEFLNRFFSDVSIIYYVFIPVNLGFVLYFQVI